MGPSQRIIGSQAVVRAAAYLSDAVRRCARLGLARFWFATSVLCMISIILISSVASFRFYSRRWPLPTRCCMLGVDGDQERGRQRPLEVLPAPTPLKLCAPVPAPELRAPACTPWSLSRRALTHPIVL
eukprot:6206932-Pleurochrysis_carterae.AAC.2